MKKLLSSLVLLGAFALTMNSVFACENCNCECDCGPKCNCAKECNCECHKEKNCNCCNSCEKCGCKCECCNKRILKIFKKKCK